MASLFCFGGRVAAFLSKKDDTEDGSALHLITNVCVKKRFSADVKLSLLCLRIHAGKAFPGGCCQENCEEVWDVREFKDHQGKGGLKMVN